MTLSGPIWFATMATMATGHAALASPQPPEMLLFTSTEARATIESLEGMHPQ